MTSSFDNLKKLKLRYKAAKKGYRASQYEILAEAMAEVVRLRADEDELEKFILHAKIKKSDLRSWPRSWITVEAVSFVTYSTKLAWKAARALEFLHDFKKVPLGKLAEELCEQGGIEKIAKLAAAEDPRRKKQPDEADDEEADEAQDEDEDKNEDENDDDEQGENSDADEDEGFDHKEEAKRGSRKRKNDQHQKKAKPQPPNVGDDDSGNSGIAVSMSPKLRKKFDAIEVGRSVKLTGIRADKSDWLNVMLEVSKVTLVKS